MSTGTPAYRSTSVISNDAYELVNCFGKDFQDALYELAESIANDRGDKTPDGLTSIEYQDVRTACDLFIQAVRRQANAPESPAGLRAMVDEMSDCVQSESDQHSR